MKKILFFLMFFFPLQRLFSFNILVMRGNISSWGGVDEHVVFLCKNLEQQGHNVCVITPVDSFFYKKSKQYSLSYRFCCNYSLFSRIKNVNLEKDCSLIVVDFNPDIIYCQSMVECLSVQEIAKKKGIKIVYHSHSGTGGFFKSEIQDGIDLIIRSSPFKEDLIFEKQEVDSVKKKRVVFLPPFYNKERLIQPINSTISREIFFKQNYDITINKNTFILCCVANLRSCKNHIVILKSLHDLVYKKKKDIHLMLAGTYFSKKFLLKLEKMVKELNIESKVHFLGFVKDVGTLLYFSDIKVLASIKESFGIALLEAGFAKKMVILSQVADSAGYLIKHNETGLLFDPYSYEDLTDKIMFCIKNPHNMNNLRYSYYHYVNEVYSISNLTKIYEKIFEDLINQV